MKKIILLGLFVLSSTAFAIDYDSVVVHGEGEAHIKPEILRISVDIKSHGKEAKSVQNLIAGETDRVKKLLEEKGVLTKDIQTDSYNLNPEYRYETNGKRIFLGYTATHSLQVVVRKLDTVSDLLVQLANVQNSDSLNTAVSNTQYDTEKRAEAETMALAAAMANAHSRAEALAKASGKSLKQVRHISDSQVNISGQPRPLLRGAMMMARAASADSAPELSPGELTVSSSVTVEYEF